MFLEESSKKRGLKRCTCGSDQCPAAPENTGQPGLCLANGQVQGPVDNLDFCCAFSVPPLHTTAHSGRRPSMERGDGERAGRISVKLSGEPCTSTALHEVQQIHLWMEGLLCWL